MGSLTGGSGHRGRISQPDGVTTETCENDRVSPTVFRSGPYRFFFFASDRNEPRHVHVGRERKAAKFWLSPVRSAYNYGFAAKWRPIHEVASGERIGE